MYLNFQGSPLCMDFYICHLVGTILCELQGCTLKKLQRNSFTWPGSVIGYTNIFDFIKTNHQYHIETLKKLPNIFIKLDTLCGVLSYNLSVHSLKLFANGATFVYMTPKPSELLRLNFNICHMFGRYDRFIWIAGMSYLQLKKCIEICLLTQHAQRVTVYTNIFDFIKTNHQNHIEMLIKLHNIFINLLIVSDVLSFNITSYLTCLQKDMFVYMSKCMLPKSYTSRTSSIYLMLW